MDKDPAFLPGGRPISKPTLKQRKFAAGYVNPDGANGNGTVDPDRSPALRTLPPTLFRETVERLKGGQTVRLVARWLMTQDRGALQHEGHYEIRKQAGQLKGLINRNEVSVDPPPEPQAQDTQAVASAHKVRLRKLQEMALADRLAGREVPNFVLCAQLELLLELQQKGVSYDQQSTMLMHIRQTGEYLCKLGSGENAWCEDYPRLDDEPLDAEHQLLLQQARAMDPADRMLGLSVFGLAQEIVKLDGEIATEEEQAGPPPADADKHEAAHPEEGTKCLLHRERR